MCVCVSQPGGSVPDAVVQLRRAIDHHLAVYIAIKNQPTNQPGSVSSLEQTTHRQQVASTPRLKPEGLRIEGWVHREVAVKKGSMAALHVSG